MFLAASTAWLLCIAPTVIDGDTFRCQNMERNVRIAGIDAPDKTCRGRRAHCVTTLENGVTATASTQALRRLFRRGAVHVRSYAQRSYGRHVGVVCADGTNVSDWMIRNGFALYKQKWNGAARRVKCPR